MKNSVINTLKYTGVVTLSQYIGGKKTQIMQIHNTGGASLFDFFADCLTAQWDSAQKSRPTKIKVLEQVAVTDTQTVDDYTYKSVSGFIFLYKAPTRDYSHTNRTSVCYSFIIPRDLIEATLSDANIGSLGLGLYTHKTPEDEPENFAAFCSLGDLDKGVLANASLVVDWHIIIANKEDLRI